MAKKISLTGLMNNYEETIDQTKQKKESRDKNAKQNATDHRKGSSWRLDERPFRKTVHFDEEVNQLINFVSNMQNTKIDDFIYEAVKAHIYDNYGKSIAEIIQSKK